MLSFLATEGSSASAAGYPRRVEEHDDYLLDAYSQTVTGVAGRVSSAVVHLKVQKPPQSPNRRQQPAPPDGRGGGTGSGFIISSDGFVVTNSHVVNGASQIEASLPDGRAFQASVVGDDPATDIAVVKIDGSNLASIAFGESDRLRVGQIAIAIEGTRLRSSLNDQLLELNALQRASSREGWQVLTQVKDVTAYVYEEASVRPLAEVETALSSSGVQAAVAPITIRDEVIGALGVYEDDGKPLSPEEQELLESISGQVAQALEAARLFEQTQRRAAELQTVATVSTVTSTMLDPDALLQTVVDLTKERFALYHAHIYVVDEAWKTLLLAAGAGEVGKKMVAEGWNIPLDHPSSIVATAAREKTSVIASDVRHSTDSPFLSNRLLPDTRSELAVPMIAGDKVLDRKSVV